MISLHRIELSRRRFLQGIAAATGSTLAVARPALAIRDRAAPAVLRGPQIELVIEETRINITGRNRIATAVNGSVPGPTVRLREGDVATMNVTNRLSETTSIHWHGVRLPANMDGVPGLSFTGIRPAETFTYRFPVVQSGTYWYHSHSGAQETTGLYGALIFEPRAKEPYGYDRDYVVVLSDWSDEAAKTILSNLKFQSDYYNYHQRTLGTFIQDGRTHGWGATISDRLRWGRMRMSPTDIMDVTGKTYTFLMNGEAPAANWTALFTRGERVRLRFINSAAMSTFDVRIPGLPLRIVQADGNDIEPVEVDEFRIGVAETYDAIVEPPQDQAYTIFAQAQDRTGYARGTLAPGRGMSATVPAMDPRPLRTMADMGMAHMGAMHEMPAGKSMPGMEHGSTTSTTSPVQSGAMGPPTVNADGVDLKAMRRSPWINNVAMAPQNRLAEAGDGLDGNGRRVLTYAQLKALDATSTKTPPVLQNIEFHLTGNMERFVWGFDGKKFSEVGPVRVRLGQRVRFVLINDTMMEHPIHLHGFLFAVENGQGDRLPLKHTINVKPGERMSFVWTADTPGHWAFHCHLQFHMVTGMFRTVVVA
jgi:CopA family copper-resistance protein